MVEKYFSYPHSEDSDIFREAIAYSEADTGFTGFLIEKDYYCSLILRNFFQNNAGLVFKGVTCISKVYTDFYRFSEDLDFIIPVAVQASRKERRTKIEPIKYMFEKLSTVIPGVSIAVPLSGHNESKQYIGYYNYQSLLIDKQEKIKIEVGLREPLLNAAELKPARTIALNPFNNRSLLSHFTVRAMSQKEMYAEKFRAALSRREPAIRDFFDLFYAVHKKKLDFQDPEFVKSVKAKLSIPGNDTIDVSKERKRKLVKQIGGQLKPVLRPVDFAEFELDIAFDLVYSMAQAL